MDFSQNRPAEKRRLAGKNLEQVRDHYRTYLFDQYLPFWNRHGIDHELGGFTCTLDHDGTLLNDNKHMWYQGRGLWVYSYLYRHFGGDEYLEVARKTRDFLLRHGRDSQGNWVTGLDRQGNVTAPANPRGYEGLFVAEGLQAYAQASGDQEAMQVAVESYWRSMAQYDDPTRMADEGYVPQAYAGQRTLGQHMVGILVLTQLLKQGNDPALSVDADRTVDAVINRFWNPEYQLMNEALANDYSRPDDANEDFIYLGHGIETLWMLLVEAMRRRDRDLFDTVAQRFRRHIEVAWDDVYGGVFRGMHVHGAPIFDKVLWAQEEVLIGCMILMEHTDLDWPWEWFGRVFDYIEDKFSLKRHGYPLYQVSGDRKVSFIPHVSRKENYHHPRHLMRCLLGLERLLERDGAVSDFWQK
jgi:N-acylglucosamine 2-epimerase